jgi:hypothetical protein
MTRLSLGSSRRLTLQGVVRYGAGREFGRDIVLACPIFAAKPPL